MFINTHKVSGERAKQLLFFQKTAKLKFKDLFLLDLAFHHRSFSNETSKVKINNERLEFLGDSVLGMVVASRLYALLADHPEGDLAKIKSVVVSEDTLSQIALSLDVQNFLLLGKGEELSGGRTKKALLADAMEAIIGALYLDSGYKTAEAFVLQIINRQIDLVLQNKHHKDYKTLLQEYIQKKYKMVPKYLLTKKEGPDHDRTFWVSVEIQGTTYGPQSGKNKKEAEQAVASLVWKNLGLDTES